MVYLLSPAFLQASPFHLISFISRQGKPRGRKKFRSECRLCVMGGLLKLTPRVHCSMATKEFCAVFMSNIQETTLPCAGINLGSEPRFLAAPADFNHLQINVASKIFICI